MLLTEQLLQKWAPVIDHEDLPKIKDNYKKAVLAQLLENEVIAQKQDRDQTSGMFLSESAPTNSVAGGAVANYDPILISLVRRALPNLIAYDICGVQPMTGPTGLIFAMRSLYGNNITGGVGNQQYANVANQVSSEALFQEANTSWTSGNNWGNTLNQVAQSGNDPVQNLNLASNYTLANGMTTAIAEALGDAGSPNDFAEMAFAIDKVTVTARSRALQASYSLELAQDLKAIHGLDAETELANILSTEILAEINREVVRTIYNTASLGCTYGTTVSGTFNLDVDANGRWSVEKFKGLIFQVEREANAISKATRRGKGNVLIVSSDVASAFAMAGVLQYTPALQSDLTVDDTGNTFAGLLHNRIKVYIDPYFGGSANGDELVTVGYKGTSPYDAGLFYCPYVPLQMVRAVDPWMFQPKIGFKTRYGMIANPFATANGDGVVGNRNTPGQSNIYYRIFRVINLM